MSDYDKPPFSVPPPTFMQTGTQTPTINEQNEESFGDVVPIEEIINNPFEPFMEQNEAPIEAPKLVEEIPPFSEISEPQIPMQETPIKLVETPKYKILDMFWLLNPKYSKNSLFPRFFFYFYPSSYSDSLFKPTTSFSFFDY